MPITIRIKAKIVVQPSQLKRWTGLRNTYKPADNRTKNAKPNDKSVAHFGKQPTIARYNKPTKNPVNRENLIISYP